MATYLIDEPPLLVFPSLARIVGLNEAIALQQIHYWIEINRKKKANFKNGYHWTYNSYREWREQFPFWSENTIYRIIRSLEGKNLLISDILSTNPRDRRKWYRISHAHLAELQDASPQLGEMHPTKLRGCTSPQLEEMKTDTTETPSEERKPRAPIPLENQTIQQKTIGALAQVMGLDPSLNGKRLAPLAAALVKLSGGETPALLAAHYGESPNGQNWHWRRSDWRGLRGQAPDERGLRETWGRWAQDAASPASQPTAVYE